MPLLTELQLSFLCGIIQFSQWFAAGGSSRELYDPVQVCRFGLGHATTIRAHCVGGEVFCMQVKCTALSSFPF